MNLKLKNPKLFRQACFIGDEWIELSKNNNLDVKNPATGENVGNVPNMGYSHAMRAVDFANQALSEWQGLLAVERAKILRKWFDLIIENADDLAKILTIEQGKPLTESKAEIIYAASYIEWFSEESKRVDGEVLQAQKENQTMMVFRQPIGVCAAITPWNFPAAMITRKVAPALAAGCTIILKPAESTPFSAIALVVLALEAGVPQGVLQILTGEPAEICRAFTESPIVRKISFTGSTQVGRLIMRNSSDNVKKISLELGGNAPLIIFKDADLESAVEGIVVSKFRNMGQTCICANRIFVHEDIYNEIIHRLIIKIRSFKIGNGLNSDVTHGPLINEKSILKIENYICDAVARGARILIGGKRSELGFNFYEPTVLIDVTDEMQISQEEIFGPVASIFIFKDEMEVLKRANATIYGLAAYIFTENRQRIHRLSKALDVGMLGINTGLISNEVAPFGGIKQSGLGREGSKHGIEDYLVMKYICMNND